MTLDIRAGDILVRGSKNHPVVWCGVWEDEGESDQSMRAMCSVTASTKRNPAISGGKRGDPVQVIASMKCTPLDPSSSNTRDMVVRSIPAAPTDLLECIVDGGDTFYHLVVERVRDA